MMLPFDKKPLISMLCLSIGSAFPASVMAQSSGGVLEEVIVTAQKRSESVQDVPFSVTAFSANAIDDLNIISVTNLAKFTPGMNISQSDPGRTKIRIRGIGSRKFDVGSESSVGVFVDEVYIARFSGIEFSLLDIARIEVLKGPQGTLFGRNTTGGAISIVSEGPSDEFGGFVEGWLGNKDSTLLRGSVTGEVAPGLTMRLSGGQEEKGGFSTNTVTGDTDDRTSEALRLIAQYAPSDDLRITGSVQYTNIEAEGLAGKSIATLPGGLAVPLLAFPPGRTVSVTPDLYSGELNYGGFSDIEATLGILRIEKELGNLDFVSLTSYRDSTVDQEEDFDRTILDVGFGGIDEDSQTFSQEFRISEDNWILGLYYYNDDAFRNDIFGWNADSLPAFLNGGPKVDESIVGVETTSWAVFGQYTFDLTGQLSLTLGGRYSYDEKDFKLEGVSSGPGAPVIGVPFVYEDDVDWDSFDPKVSLDWKVSDDIMVYASASTGYKSGGVQFTAFRLEQATEVFDPEELEAYQVGIKADFLDNTLRVNAETYFYDYTNLQQQRVEVLPGGPPSAVTRNAGESEIKGFEIDAQWLPVENVSFRLGYNYLDAEFTEFDAGNDDFSGNPVPNSPENTLTAVANYDLRLGDWGLTFGVEWFWTDEFNYDVTDEKITEQESYDVGSGHLILTSPNENLMITAFVENVTDEEFFSSIVRRDTEVLVNPADGRRYGIKIKYAF